ncbi:MAG: hypothetical protein ABEH86_04760 [Haloarcula sp.]
MTTNDADDPTITLRGGDQTVSLVRDPTPTGERLRIESGDDTTRVDALALETLTWQADEFFRGLTGDDHTAGANAVRTDETLQIGNEYTVVQLTVLDTDDGPRLELDSPKLGYSCRLDASELAALCRQEMTLFSDLLKTPLGPVDEHDEDPLFDH